MHLALALLLSLTASDIRPLVPKDFSGAVVVTNDRDEVVFAEGYQHKLSTCFDLASVGKMFTAVAMAQLAEQKRVQLDVPIAPYLPPALAKLPFAQKVTIAQLLAHRSGVPDLPEDLFRNPPARLSGYVPFFASATLEFEPGSQRSYSNAGFVLAGIILETVSGQTYDAYIKRNVFRRAGMKACSAGLPHGGARIAAPELVKFFRALRGGKLVARELAGLAHGFGTLEFAKDRLVGHSGGDKGVSADAYTYWKSGITIVVLSDQAPPASHDVARGIRKVVEPAFD